MINLPILHRGRKKYVLVCEFVSTVHSLPRHWHRLWAYLFASPSHLLVLSVSLCGSVLSHKPEDKMILSIAAHLLTSSHNATKFTWLLLPNTFLHMVSVYAGHFLYQTLMDGMVMALKEVCFSKRCGQRGSIWQRDALLFCGDSVCRPGKDHFRLCQRGHPVSAMLALWLREQ